MKEGMHDQILKEAEKIIGEGSSVRIRSTGRSMRPFLVQGRRDTVIVSPFTKKELRRGEIVFFRYEGRYVIHRILRKKGEELEIMGDGNTGKPEMACVGDVIGVVSGIVRANGKVIPSGSPLWRLSSIIWVWLRPVRYPMLAVYDRITRSSR